MKYYHNPRCAKSRAGLKLLEEAGLEPEIVLYMKSPITPDELTAIIDRADIPAADLIRRDEKIWKEEFADKELSEEELVLLMIEHPQLMQRPILVRDDRAVVGRPPERLKDLL